MNRIYTEGTSRTEPTPIFGDNWSILIIIGLGVAGLITVLFSTRASHKTRLLTHNHKAWTLPQQPEQHLVKSSLVKFSQRKTQGLELQGLAEVGQFMQYRIHRYDARNRYELHLGNEILRVTSASGSFPLHAVGETEIKLIAKYRGEQAIVCTNVLDVKDSWLASTQ